MIILPSRFDSSSPQYQYNLRASLCGHTLCDLYEHSFPSSGMAKGTNSALADNI